ncbi:hypothetical protein K1719_034307 [Acacia pycnantha]|nr:hypothetical protein K1719_034307 [Acacia pycnantha]
MEVLMSEGSIEASSSEERREEHEQAILQGLSYLSLKDLHKGLSKYAKGTKSTVKTLTWLNTLEIEDCFELECVIKGKSNEISLGGSEDLVPSLRTLRLVKLRNLINFHRGVRLRCEIFRVWDCPNLKQTVADMLEPEDLAKEYKSPEEERLNKDPAPEESKVKTSSPVGSLHSSIDFHLSDLLFEYQITS